MGGRGRGVRELREGGGGEGPAGGRSSTLTLRGSHWFLSRPRPTNLTSYSKEFLSLRRAMTISTWNLTPSITTFSAIFFSSSSVSMRAAFSVPSLSSPDA